MTFENITELDIEIVHIGMEETELLLEKLTKGKSLTQERKIEIKKREQELEARSKVLEKKKKDAEKENLTECPFCHSKTGFKISKDSIKTESYKFYGSEFDNDPLIKYPLIESWDETIKKHNPICIDCNKTIDIE